MFIINSRKDRYRFRNEAGKFDSYKVVCEKNELMRREKYSDFSMLFFNH